MKRILTLFLTFACAAALADAPAYAKGHKDAVHAAAQSIVPVSVAVAAVRRAYPGSEVLSHRLVNGENPYYMIRILTPEGRRLDVRVDAISGRVRR
ncbi:PepSY domain-containing protein [Oceanicaulis sp. MMSF_3324]|uniref:PepSY domain-containing protein n=1 Tax=Oceanicaulis sp. MMSF_3324 TaxID=3046702 RepID=UPI00273F47FD|nr:PepSY domain-containing protein [Oceanicaulis sp. MMSF_3324]